MNWIFLQTLRGSFSAVSTPIFASKYSLESSRRDLQDLHAFAPLGPQYFRNFANISSACTCSRSSMYILTWMVLSTKSHFNVAPTQSNHCAPRRSQLSVYSYLFVMRLEIECWHNDEMSWNVIENSKCRHKFASTRKENRKRVTTVQPLTCCDKRRGQWKWKSIDFMQLPQNQLHSSEHKPFHR